MTLHSLRGHSILVAPVRIGLGLVWFAAGRFAGVGATSALLACAGGVFSFVFLAFNDPRVAFLQRRGEALSMPAGATVAGAGRQIVTAMFPSTVGISLLAAIAIVTQPVLSVILGGISMGLGVAGLLKAYGTDPALYFDPRTGVVYRS
jgi:hypothetical protein